jgi:hypothetical protein
MNWPHDDEGNPMQIIAWKQTESVPVDPGAKNTAWLGWEHQIMRPVPMGAKDETMDDRAALGAEVEKIIEEVSSVLFQKRNEALEALRAPVKTEK